MGEITDEPGLGFTMARWVADFLSRCVFVCVCVCGGGFTMARWVADFLSRGGVGEGSVPVAETTDYPGLKLAHAP